MRSEGARIPQEDIERQNSEKMDRKSPEFFIDLKDKMIAQIGIPDQSEIKYSLYKLSDQLGNLQTIDTVLDKRSNGKVNSLKNSVKDIFRKEVPKGYIEIDKYMSFGRRHESAAEGIKTNELLKWKQVVLDYLKKLDQLETPLNMLSEIELHPETRSLLEKYNKNKVYELLEPGLEITEQDQFGLAADIASSLEYRNRKIKEFVAYRYARVTPTEINEEDFIKNAHKIIGDPEDESKNQGYRTEVIKNSDDFNAPFHPNLLPFAMSKFRAKVENTKDLDTKQDIQKESLKNYILFEIIHPFSDGNGRTGRALFVHLQRRFANKNLPELKPVHMPLARYESGTIYPQEVSGGKHKIMHLGSLSLDINTLLIQIIQREDLVNLGKDLPGWHAFEQKTFTVEDVRTIVDNTIEKIITILDSKEVEEKLDEICMVIEKQSSKDDVESEDWNIVYESLKEQLKK